MIRDVLRAFGGDATLTERQGAILVAASGVVFSVTAIAYRAVESATEWQFLAYRGISTAVAMVLLILARRKGRPVRLADTTRRTVLRRPRARFVVDALHPRARAHVGGDHPVPACDRRPSSPR